MFKRIDEHFPMIDKIFIVAIAIFMANDALTTSNVDLKEVKLRSTNQVTTPVGGNGGTWFNDCNADRDQIREIKVRFGRLVDGIQVTYGGDLASSHGGNGGIINYCQLAVNETISLVKGRYGRVLDQIEFVTSKGRVCGPYGGNGGSEFAKFIPGYHLSCIFGRSGRLIDQIAFVWDKN